MTTISKSIRIAMRLRRDPNITQTTIVNQKIMLVSNSLFSFSPEVYYFIEWTQQVIWPSSQAMQHIPDPQPPLGDTLAGVSLAFLSESLREIS